MDEVRILVNSPDVVSLDSVVSNDNADDIFSFDLDFSKMSDDELLRLEFKQTQALGHKYLTEWAWIHYR